MEQVSSQSFADYLSTLDEASLITLLEARPDVLIEPVPRGFIQLVYRLDGTDSLVAAMRTLNRDTVRVGQGLAALGGSATVPALAAWLGASQDAVGDGGAELCVRGLAWRDSGALQLPERLLAHWSADIGAARPVETMARSVLVAELRTAVQALGADADGLGKPELGTRLSELMSETDRLITIISGLSKGARDRLNDLRRSLTGDYSWNLTYGSPGAISQTETLIAAGLVLVSNRQPELPREVAVAAWRADTDLALTGRPMIPHPDVDATMVRSGAQAAAEGAVGRVTALLDEARATPVVALKKGGVGPRERSRLAKRLSMPEGDLLLWIDLAYAAGLLGLTDGGYAPTSDYQDWRAAEMGLRWAVLASAWFALEHAPSSREIEGDKEVPPPLPLMSGAGWLRRTMVGAAGSAGPGASVRATGREIDWFCPLHGYDPIRRDDKIAAAVREAELLGVVAVDVLSELGEHLLAVDEAAPADAVEELARRCGGLLPEATFSVIIQSDLTAMVAGQPSAGATQLLRDAAVAESRGAAGTWRFSSSSVRAALDAGWAADDLLAQLRTMSAHAVPQPLEYLITDVARRHGHVRVRGMRCCVVADEATTTEVLHTRSLAKLQLSRLAPTVLASPLKLEVVLTRLREVGFYPIAEDAAGTMIVPRRQEHQGSPRFNSPARRPPRVSPVDLARRLAAHPDDDTMPDAGTLRLLARLNTRLNEAELALLADAMDHCGDIVITYRDANGTRTVRKIQPQQLYGKWIDAWCHLRNAQREFSVANIESVSPAS
ncbi:helicase-associated domain-containing protein [Frankia sp. Cas3]|uniref:helicase-associated domain-containing protein n=1 Tax=Frankia sp. Cas3 TaxID=3073926 RepID=UPI002AD50AEA|nr:helicase-associated domain-containing protein [Frankia sp. Cas3]